MVKGSLSFGVAIAVAVSVASLVVTFLGYRLCTTMAQIDDVLPRWAKERGFRIVHKEARIFFRGPFFSLFSNASPVYYVTLEDEQHQQRNAWIRLGWWYFVGFRERIEVIWDD